MHNSILQQLPTIRIKETFEYMRQEEDGDVYLEEIEETLFIAMIIDHVFMVTMAMRAIILYLVKSIPYTLASGGQR